MLWASSADHQMALFSPEAKMPAFANGFYFAEIVSITKPIGLSPLEIVFNNWLCRWAPAALPVFSPWHTVVHTVPGWPTGVKMPAQHPPPPTCRQHNNHREPIRSSQSLTDITICWSIDFISLRLLALREWILLADVFECLAFYLSSGSRQDGMMSR